MYTYITFYEYHIHVTIVQREMGVGMGTENSLWPFVWRECQHLPLFGQIMKNLPKAAVATFAI